MVDVSPELWKNPTLGEAANGKFLDEETQQHLENVAAAREGRPARTLEKKSRWPLPDPSAEVNPPSGGYSPTFIANKPTEPTTKVRK